MRRSGRFDVFEVELEFRKKFVRRQSDDVRGSLHDGVVINAPKRQHHQCFIFGEACGETAFARNWARLENGPIRIGKKCQVQQRKILSKFLLIFPRGLEKLPLATSLTNQNTCGEQICKNLACRWTVGVWNVIPECRPRG